MLMCGNRGRQIKGSKADKNGCTASFMVTYEATGSLNSEFHSTSSFRNYYQFPDRAVSKHKRPFAITDQLFAKRLVVLLHP